MLQDLVKNYPLILAECAVAERLRRRPRVELHPTLFNTPLIYGPDHARDEMTSIYREYLDVANKSELPILLTAPTWRLDAARIAEAGAPKTINSDAVQFLINLRGQLANHHSPVAIGALVGPQNDCYRPDLAPSADEAEKLHTPQIEELANTEADFLLAQTLPAVGEAYGIARAMAATGKPYIISFCTGTDGRVLDGTPLPEAVDKLDEKLPRAPVGYFVNCTHPRFLTEKYEVGELDRLIGIQANGSSCDVTSLDGSDSTQADPVYDWSKSMADLHYKHGVSILGGCCGTSTEHLKALSQIR